MKKLHALIVLTFFFVGVSPKFTFALDKDKNKDDNAYSYYSFYWDYPTPDEGGISLINTGHRWVKNNLAFDLAMLQMGMRKSYFANINLLLRYRSFLEMNVGYLFTHPYNPFDYALMEHIEQTGLRLQLANTMIETQEEFGLISSLYKKETGKREQMLVFRSVNTINQMLINYVDFFRWDVGSVFTYEFAIEYDEALYQIEIYSILKQNHVYGELTLKPLLGYVDSIANVSYLKNQKNFIDLTSFSVFDDPQFYNVTAAAMSEYRFFFLKFLKSYKWYEDLYMSGTYNIAFLGKDTVDLKQNYMKMYFGGGFGFNIFGSFPMSVQLIMDGEGHLGYSIVSSIISPF